MLNFLLLLIIYISKFSWLILQILTIFIFIIIIKRFKLGGRKTALVGFGFLVLTLLSSLVRLDYISGKFAEFVWIFFAISFIQEFADQLKNVKK